MDANKQKALDLALGQIEKAFGKEAICKLGGGGVKNVEAIPTGALSLDLALGVGGLPRGRVIEIYGPEAGGKTTLSLHVAAQTQKMGGTRVRAKVTKNKVAPPYRQAEFTMILGHGISREACIIDKGVEAGFIEKSGSWFIYGDEKLGQGAENARQYLKDNPELAAEIEDKLYVKYLGHHYNGKKADAAEQAKTEPAKEPKKVTKK